VGLRGPRRAAARPTDHDDRGVLVPGSELALEGAERDQPGAGDVAGVVGVALAHVEHRLGKMGVIRALQEAGFESGDDVEIDGVVFELD
jgi:hypothetical protein